jgi:hypothetical protein
MIWIGRRWIIAVGFSAASMALSFSGSWMDGQPASSTTPAPTATPQRASTQLVRGAYGKDSSTLGYSVMAADGFTSVMTGPYKELLDPLAAHGLKGVVWLGAWRNAPTCGFERDDATITRLVSAIAGNPAILAYYLADEPHVTECPNAPALFKKRTDLVHSLDPGSKTFTVIQASENGVAHDYAPWAGSVDIIGFDVYPCPRSSGTCNFGLIDSAIQAIKAAGVTQYWAVVQDFQDCYYRLPTPDELASQFDHWAQSSMSGYFVFSWNYQSVQPNCPGTTLDSHPENIAQLKYENSRTFRASTITSTQQSSSRSGSLIVIIVLTVLVVALVAVAAVPMMWPRGRRT